MADFQLIETLVSKEQPGLYVRVHTEIRSYRSHLISENSGTMGGLYQDDKPSIKGQKDFFLQADSSLLADKASRSSLYSRIKSVRNTKESLAISKLIDDFFAHSRAVKQNALAERGGKPSILNEDAVWDIQNEINTRAVDVRVVILSLLRREERAFRGSRISQNDPMPHLEKRVVKFLCDPNTEITPEYVISVINATKTLSYQGEYIITEDRAKTIEDLKHGRKGGRVIVTPNNADLVRDIRAQAQAEKNLKASDLVVDFSATQLFDDMKLEEVHIKADSSAIPESTKKTKAELPKGQLDAVVAEAKTAEGKTP